MPSSESFTAAMIGKASTSSGTAQEIRTKVAGEDIEVGLAVSLDDTDPNVVNVFDGSEDVYGVARYSLQADQDFVRSDVARDRAEYKDGDLVAVQRPGSSDDIIVEFLEAADLGDGVAVDEATGKFRPDDTTETDVEELTYGEVVAEPIEVGGVLIGAIRLRPVE